MVPVGYIDVGVALPAIRKGEINYIWWCNGASTTVKKKKKIMTMLENIRFNLSSIS